jgi:hypothetical protein
VSSVRSKDVWILPLLALSGCAEPKLEFRGYTDLSGCTDIIDAELANGSSYEGVFDAEDPEDPAQTIELSGTIFDEPVRIDVTCTAGRIDSIHYLSRARDPRDTGAVFARFMAGLDAIFGQPDTVTSENARSLRYLCRNPSPVLLEEWRLEPDEEQEAEDEEPDHEVYIAVVPSATACLETDR